MIKKITLRPSGRSVSAKLPREMAARLHVQPGDRIFAIETENGVLLTPYDLEFQDAVQVLAEVRRQYRKALKKLA